MNGYPIAYASAERREELRRMEYPAYLATPEWKQVRWFALNRDGFSCVLCGATEGLCVHHRRYDRRGFEHGEDVVTLCERCHRSHHGRTGSEARAAAIMAEIRERRTERERMAREARVSSIEVESTNAAALLAMLKGLPSV